MDNDDLTAKLYVAYIFRRAAKDLSRIDRHHPSPLEEVVEVSGDDNAEPSTVMREGGCLDDQMTENLSEDEDSNEMRFGAERLIDESNLAEQPRIDMNPKEVSLSKKVGYN